jgi:hypothetical protein
MSVWPSQISDKPMTSVRRKDDFEGPEEDG